VLHDTAARMLERDPLRFGVASMAQEPPCDASARVTGMPYESRSEPTAAHAWAAEHDTPLSRLVSFPLGLPGDWSFHLLPFQVSANAPSTEDPTAVQASVALHDTAASRSEAEPLGLGVLWTAQVVPFHASAKASCVPKEL